MALTLDKLMEPPTRLIRAMVLLNAEAHLANAEAWLDTIVLFGAEDSALRQAMEDSRDFWAEIYWKAWSWR